MDVRQSGRATDAKFEMLLRAKSLTKAEMLLGTADNATVLGLFT